jgi:hypothetical protein
LLGIAAAAQALGEVGAAAAAAKRLARTPLISSSLPISPATCEGLEPELDLEEDGGRRSPIGYPARHGINIRRRSTSGSACVALTSSLTEPLPSYKGMQMTVGTEP